MFNSTDGVGGAVLSTGSCAATEPLGNALGGGGIAVGNTRGGGGAAFCTEADGGTKAVVASGPLHFVVLFIIFFGGTLNGAAGGTAAGGALTTVGSLGTLAGMLGFCGCGAAFMGYGFGTGYGFGKRNAGVLAAAAIISSCRTRACMAAAAILA